MNELNQNLLSKSLTLCLDCVLLVTDRGMAHSEESRLANLLRRVSREDDRDRRLSTLKQMKEFIGHAENKVVSGLFHTSPSIFPKRSHLCELSSAICGKLLGTKWTHKEYLYVCVCLSTSLSSRSRRLMLHSVPLVRP